MYEGAEQPQLLGEDHCAEAVPQRLNMARLPQSEVSPNDDRDMETFLPEDKVRKR